MNKRGDISVTILVIGVFIVCGLALFSFYLAGFSGAETFSRMSIIEKVNSLSDEIKFYKNSEISKNPSEIMDIFDNQETDGKLVFSGSHQNGIYKVKGTSYKQDFEIFGFGIGSKKAIFSAEYSFRG